MSDLSGAPQGGPGSEVPFQVHADPKVVQIEAGIRQLALIVGTVAAVAGSAKVSAGANTAMNLAPAVATVAGIALSFGSFIWGQIATRKHAKQAAVMAKAVPNSIATLK